MWTELGVLITTLVVIQGQSTSEEYGGYRLNEIYLPSRYVVDLEVSQDVFDGAGVAFSGKVSITFEISESTDVIRIHKQNAITSLTLFSGSTPITVSSFEKYNSTTEILTIELSQSLVVGTTYTLNIEYNGDLDTTSMSGFYLSSYRTSYGATEYLVTTQFQPTHARHAFPCFDEPQYKATFLISITHPAAYNALSNMPQAQLDPINTTYAKTTFKETPRMSTYLVAFIVSNFSCSLGEVIDVDTPHQVCSRKEQAQYRDLAVRLGSVIMNKLETITGLKYAQQLPKMDEVAIPDFSAGAMENWGLVTYRETGLLYSEEDSSNSYKKSIAQVIAHEFTHMWFGNLVTCKWWDYTFLNEGFARLYQYFAAALVEELSDWELDKHFVVEQVHTALLTDSSLSADSLTSKASSQSQVSNKFSTITYNKGAAVLRMIEHVIGAQNFLSGIHSYLDTYSYKATTPKNLWDVLQRFAPTNSLPSDATLEVVIENWVEKSGHPLVTVTSSGNDVILSQTRFLLSGSEDREWYIPISYTLSNDTKGFANTSPKFWLRPGQAYTLSNAINNQGWIIINNQQSGFYRVNYDTALWSRIKETLQENHTEIDVLNRAQLLNDVYNFARSGLLKYSDAMSVFSYLKNEVEYYPWYSAIVGLNHLLQRIGYESTIGRRLIAHQLENLDKVYATVPFSKLDSNNQVYTMKQVAILTRACRYGLTSCVEEVKGLFERYKSGNSVPKNLRSIVYCNALRYSTDLHTDFNFLWDKFQSASLASEVVTILGSFGCAQDASHIKWFLKQTINATSGVRLQDFSTAWSGVYSSGGRIGAVAAMEFIAENYAELTAYYSGVGSLISTIANYFFEESQLESIQKVLNVSTLSNGHRATANSAITSARSNIAWASSKAEDVSAFLDELQSSGAVHLASSALLIAIGALAFNRGLVL
ncbi:membrane alanyl aminopeptidase [Cylas formicarius]|uniref:membrane alanyl aminopeptidase n=1 Tax=Cylas formicarius TaxID=197179 RepID=UPI0029587739|nr:membrane alanyl aminopeptidase [Cylas formicarius]